MPSHRPRRSKSYAYTFSFRPALEGHRPSIPARLFSRWSPLRQSVSGRPRKCGRRKGSAPAATLRAALREGDSGPETHCHAGERVTVNVGTLRAALVRRFSSGGPLAPDCVSCRDRPCRPDPSAPLAAVARAAGLDRQAARTRRARSGRCCRNRSHARAHGSRSRTHRE